LETTRKSNARERGIRALWRFVLFLAVLFFAIIIALYLERTVASLLSGRGYRPLVTDLAGPAATLLATWVMLKAVDRTSWDYVGLGRAAAAPRTIAFGALAGFLPIAIPSAFLIMIGQLDIVPSPEGSWWGTTSLTFLNLLPAAFGEELFIRGYLFSIMRDAIGWRWTLIWTSVVFGLLHMSNPGADAQSVGIVMLAGFFLGSLYLATKSLYAATAAHFVWNWFMAAGLHSPVSGIPMKAPDYQVIDAGPDWLTGGPWGPEGGFGAALGMFAILIYLHARHLRRTES
jgi:membrane protease YdiL (CAAX protease family)